MPVTWRTSRWVRYVAGRTGEPVTWKFLSLAVLNEGKDVPEQFRPVLAFGRTAHRVLAAADQKYGQEAVERLYSALGRRLHYENAGPDPLRSPQRSPRRSCRPTWSTPLRTTRWTWWCGPATTRRRPGWVPETGSPVTAVDGGPGFFGPVVAPVPEGADADRLFEALRLLSAVPQFSELKRARIPF